MFLLTYLLTYLPTLWYRSKKKRTPMHEHKRKKCLKYTLCMQWPDFLKKVLWSLYGHKKL